MDRQGKRLAAAEAALAHLIDFCRGLAEEAHKVLGPQSQRTQSLLQQLEIATQACQGGGLSYLFGLSRRQLRTFVDQLAAFARQYLAEAESHSAVQFYLQLAGRLEERLRELSFCRQRLRNLRETLESDEDPTANLPDGRYATDVTPTTSPPPSTETYWDNLQETSTVRVVLPGAESDLARASDRFVTGLTPEQWQKLDEDLQERVLKPLGGLHHLCVTSGDLLRGIAAPLTAQAALSLGELLPVTDVAEVETSAAVAGGVTVAKRATSHFEEAVPLVPARDNLNQTAFLLVPASDQGKKLGIEARAGLPALHLLRVPGQNDLMFCREQGNLCAEDVERLIRPFQAAYAQLAHSPQTSPHSRFDVSDWVPLE